MFDSNELYIYAMQLLDKEYSRQLRKRMSRSDAASPMFGSPHQNTSFLAGKDGGSQWGDDLKA